MDARIFVLIVLCFPYALLTQDGGCTIELECAECIPENMPTVRGGARAGPGGALHAAPGDELVLECGGGPFLAYPLHAALTVRCRRGLYLVPHDNTTRHLLDLGCQQSVFEDVLHQVDHCSPPLEGRAYQMREAGSGVIHLATLCFDADGGVAAHAQATGGALRLRAHEHAAAPRSLLGSFGEMFDASTRRAAERLYSDDAALTRRLHERFRHTEFAFAGQTMTAARLLAGAYFAPEHRAVAEFASNKVGVWSGVAAGNLRHLHADVAAAVRAAPARRLRVYAGTHGVASLRAGAPRPELHLGGGRRFPVPRYLWTAVLAPDAAAGVALVVLNDPFVTVSEIREAVFCESACARVSWLQALRRHGNYERPLLGLVFCCDLPSFAATVTEMPRVFNRTIAPLNDL